MDHKVICMKDELKDDKERFCACDECEATEHLEVRGMSIGYPMWDEYTLIRNTNVE